MSTSKLDTPFLKSSVVAIILSIGFSVLAYNSNIEASDKQTAEASTMIKVRNITPNWVKPSVAELKKSLSPIEFEVTQKDGTERPFSNKYWDNKQEGSASMKFIPKDQLAKLGYEKFASQFK